LYNKDNGVPALCAARLSSTQPASDFVGDIFIKEIQLAGPLDVTQRVKILEISTRCPVHMTMKTGPDVVTVLLSNEPMEDKATTRCEHMRGIIDTCK
jgi:hypothetical protein